MAKIESQGQEDNRSHGMETLFLFAMVRREFIAWSGLPVIIRNRGLSGRDTCGFRRELAHFQEDKRLR